jgi:hypothetical protein
LLQNLTFTHCNSDPAKPISAVNTVSCSDSDTTSIPHPVNIASDKEKLVSKNTKAVSIEKNLFIDILFFK